MNSTQVYTLKTYYASSPLAFSFRNGCVLFRVPGHKEHVQETTKGYAAIVRYEYYSILW